MADLGNTSDLELEREALLLKKKRAMATEAPAEPSLARKAVQAVTMPIRGLRGAGVAAQRVLEGDQLGRALERGAEAVKPGFVPEKGERIGAAAGEIAATAPLMAATGGGTLMAQALKGVLSSGALTAVMEASERGDVEPSDVVVSSTLGGAIPLIGPSLRAVARVVRGTGKVAATSGTTLAKDAAEELLDDPTLLEQYKGTAEAVGERVKAIQKALVKQHEEAGAILQKARAKVGIAEPFEESLARVQKEGFKPADIQQITKSFELLTADKTPAALLKEAKAGGLGKDAAKVVASMAKRKTGPVATDRLRALFRLRSEVDDLINYPAASADVPKISSADQAFLKQMRGKINETIEKIPGGKKLREADALYAESRVLYDDFQKQISTQGKAEDLIQRILKGGEIEDAIGRKGEYSRLIKQIEAKKKELLLDPARKELAARSFRTAEANSYTGILPMAGGPEGLAGLLTGTRAAARVPDAMAVPFGPPNKVSPFRAALQAAASYTSRRGKR